MQLNFAYNRLSTLLSQEKGSLHFRKHMLTQKAEFEKFKKPIYLIGSFTFIVYS